MIFPLFFLGCWSLPTEVLLTGQVLEQKDGVGIEGAAIAVHTPLGEPFSEGSSGADGEFEIGVPASNSFFVTFEAEDHVPTSFTGLAGSEDVVADEGTLFLRSTAELEALRAEFGNCPSAQDEGPIVEGEVRAWLPVDAEPEELPPVTTAWITVYDSQDLTTEACYLDDDGLSLEDGDRTGNTGRFAVFGAPTGPVSIQVSYDLTDDYSLDYWYIARAPEGGVVPMYPAWVELP